MGVFTFHYAPCENGCDYTLGRHCDLHPVIVSSKKQGYNGSEDNVMEEFAIDITKRICEVLTNKTDRKLGATN